MNKTVIAIAVISALLGLSAPARAEEAQVPQSVAQMQLSFAPLVQKTGPAVVNIYTKRVVREQMQLSPFFNDPFFNQFFGAAPGFAGPERERIQRSLGSGVILDETGVIATNHHVIKDASEITVVTADGREFEARKLLDDDKFDLAILKVEPKGDKLPHIDMADSDAAQVGDIVLAIGNPFGVGQTVTSGIVSALARTEVGFSDYGSFIQTDAAINPGNSGGALIDIRGKLLGINTAIFSKDGGSLGIGFAIPSNMVKAVLEAALHGGKVVHPWTGITSQDVTPDMLDSLGLPRARGTLVAKVVPGGPADKAGLKSGDVILSLDGHEVQDARSMRFRLAMVPVGTPVKLGLWRKGKDVETVMTTAAPPETPPRQTTKLTGRNPLAGAIVMNISPAVQEEIGPLGKDSGVVVSKAEEGSAAQLGLQEGDIILSVNGQDTTSVEVLKKSLKAETGRWQVRMLRDGRVMNLVISG